jgi:phospholipid N-methyltransferase
MTSRPSRTEPAAVESPLEVLWERFESGWTEHVEFLQGFLRRPTRTGALVPSSAELARAMVQGCALRDCEVVVELGPGTGSFTRIIVEEIGSETLFLALELDAELARGLRRRFPSFLIHCDSAERLRRHLHQLGKKRADCIVSGLPWATFPKALQERILGAVVKSLAPEGTFTTFAYLHALWMPSACRLRRRLAALFGEVKTSRVVWRNLPPALVYRCRQPRSGAVVTTSS